MGASTFHKLVLVSGLLSLFHGAYSAAQRKFFAVLSLS